MEETPINKNIIIKEAQYMDTTFSKNTLFSVNFLPLSLNVGQNKNKMLILSGCSMSLVNKNNYSEFAELNSYTLNYNDYNCGRIDIEFSFESNTYQYEKFWAGCFSFRQDDKIIKINGNIESPSYTKITQDGKMALTVSFYLRNTDELESIERSSRYCFEGFIAIGNKKNVYGIMCVIERESDDKYIIAESNTFRIYKKAHIKYLIH